MIYIGSDHAGVELKEKVGEFLDKRKIQFEDLGSFDSKSKDDYPDFAFKVGEKVARNKNNKGILVCGSGTGMVIAANKVKGIRAAMIYDNYSAKKSREDNDANVACLRNRNFSDEDSIKFIRTWLNSKFSSMPRHKRRIKKISNYEKGNR